MTTETAVPTLTLQELFNRAAERTGLRIDSCYQNPETGEVTASHMIGSYKLDDRLLGLLEANRIWATWKPGESMRGGRKHVLIDCNDDAVRERDLERKSTSWEFPRDAPAPEDKAEISLFIQLSFRNGASGITFRGKSMGRLSGPAHYPSSFRMFRILTYADPFASHAAKLLAASDGERLLTWKDMELEGLRSLNGLFKEFANGKPNVMWLGGTSFLQPRPFDNYSAGSKIFLLPDEQERVLAGWREQLAAFRESLVP